MYTVDQSIKLLWFHYCWIYTREKGGDGIKAFNSWSYNVLEVQKLKSIRKQKAFDGGRELHILF